MTSPGLEGRIADLEKSMRSLMTTNWTDRASVVNAAGASVPLSGLAFGQVTAIRPEIGLFSQVAVAGQNTLLGSTLDCTYPANWVYLADPHVDVLVTGGRLRVDWAAVVRVNAFSAPTGSGFVYYHALSYVLDFLGPPETSPLPASGTRVLQPDYYRSLEARDNAALAFNLQAGSFYVHSGLTPGWYRVSLASFFGHSAVPSTVTRLPTCDAEYPRIAATPF